MLVLKLRMFSDFTVIDEENDVEAYEICYPREMILVIICLDVKPQTGFDKNWLGEKRCDHYF